MESSFGMFSMFELFIGAYLIYAAIKGSGKLYENDYLKCSPEQYVKVMRKLAIVSGVLMVISSGLELLAVTEAGSMMAWILWFISFSSIIGMLVYSAKMTDRDAARAGRPTNRPATPEKPYDPLRAAFVFDDEDEEDQTGK